MALQVHSTVAANAAVGALLKFVQNKGAVQGPCDCTYYQNKITKLEEKIQKLDPSTPQQKKFKNYLKDLGKSDKEIDADIDDLKDFFKQTFSQEPEEQQKAKLKDEKINMKIIIAPLIYSYFLTSTRMISDETFDKLKQFSSTKPDVLVTIRNQQKSIEPLYNDTELFIKTIKNDKDKLTQTLKGIGIPEDSIVNWLNLILPFKGTPFYINYSESQTRRKEKIKGVIEKKYNDENEKYEKLKNIIKTAKSTNATKIIFTEEFKNTEKNQNNKKLLDPFIISITAEIEEDIRNLERIIDIAKKKLSKEKIEEQINTLKKENLIKYSSREEQKILSYKVKSKEQIEKEIKTEEGKIKLNPDEQPDRIHWKYFEKEILLPPESKLPLKKGGSRMNKTRKIKHI
jgi:hypothetical protein